MMLAKKSPKSGKKKKKRSIYTDKATSGPKEIIPKHKHCLNCGVSIPADRETCSESCRLEWEKMLKRKKLWTYLPIIGTALLILFWILVLANS